MIRKAAVAGMFYPAQKEKLISLISGFFEKAKPSAAEHGIIVPHAGYVYSGKTAGYGFRSMFELLKEKDKIDNIIILGPSHYVYFEGILCDENNDWETPLGKIKLKKISEIKENKIAHAKEHSIEVQVPFIQFIAEKLKRELTITPLIVGELTQFEVRQYAEILLKQKNCFFVISSDLSHYLNLAYAQKIDKETIDNIINMKTEKLEACGKIPIMIAIEMAKLKGWRFKLLDYSTSAESSGDKNAVVGYAAIGF